MAFGFAIEQRGHETAAVAHHTAMARCGRHHLRAIAYWSAGLLTLHSPTHPK
jgi:hypothetical protein